MGKYEPQHYKLNFPKDCSHPFILAYRVKDVLGAIDTYHKRFEEAQHDAEFSRQTEEGLKAFTKRFST